MEPIYWETLEYPEKHRGKDWFAAVWLIAISGAVTSFILGNFLFGALILIGTISLMLFAVRKPEKLIVTIDKTGVRINKQFYPYHTIDSFWVEEKKESSRLFLGLKKALIPYTVISIERQAPEKVRNYLARFLEEKEHTESLFEVLLGKLGF
ncbi:MAG: hypothetical protein KAR00_02185 [Candidatus Pacebacteria bacterium]|nr:hypothetical protein [Candidatus Paceibacterota bacterium]